MIRGRWLVAAVTLLVAATVPVAGQEAPADSSAQNSGMGQGMMQTCHAMMGGGSMMGAQGMMGSQGAMGGHQGGMMGVMGGQGGMSGHQGHMTGGQKMMGSGWMMGSQGMAGMGMMRGTGVGPQALLGAADRLGLNDDQTARLQDIASTSRGSHQTHMQAAAAARKNAADALSADSPDLTAYQDALQEAANHMVQAHVAMTRASIEARAVLTPDQLKKLGELTAQGGMMSGMGTGGGHAQHHR